MKEETKKILEFTTVLEEFKKIERWKGQFFWKDYSFPDRYESIADHTWRMAMLVVIIEEHLSQPLNLAKALKMTLIHDIPEIITGDMSPLDNKGTTKNSHAGNKEIAKARHKAENVAAKQIFEQLPKRQGIELHNLWIEYEKQESFEARVVKALDRIEGKLQAAEYAGGKMVEKHLEFSLEYGVETFDVDPVLQELGNLVVESLKEDRKQAKVKSSNP